MTTWRIAAVLAFCTAGCSDPTAPGSRVIPLGTYEYQATVHTPSPVTFAGRLIIDYADAALIDGHWEVEGFQSLLTGKDWNNSAYLAWARGTQGGMYNHRLARRNGKIECSGAHPTTRAGAFISYAITCEVR